MTKAAKPTKDEGVRDEPITIPAINADDDFASFVQAEMDEASAEISRLNSLKITREQHFAIAIDRLIQARDAEFAALDEQITRQTRKHGGCSAALQDMGVEQKTAKNVVALKSVPEVEEVSDAA